MLTTILILIILFLLAYIIIPKIAKAIRKHDEDMWEDWTRTDDAMKSAQYMREYELKNKSLLSNEQHPFTNGDCCRCEECTERYKKELAETLKKHEKTN